MSESDRDNLPSKPSIDAIEVVELDDVDVDMAIFDALHTPASEEAQQEVTESDDLNELEFFKDVEPAVVAKIKLNSDVITLSPGQPLIPSGQLNTKMFFILEGQIRILSNNQNKVVGVVDVGQCAGLKSAVDQKPSTADFVAADPVRALVVEYAGMVEYTRQSHVLACNLSELLASCLRGDNIVRVGEKQNSQEEGYVDTLTGLHNQRWFFRMLPRQLARSLMDGNPLIMVALKVVQLEQIGQKYGEAAQEKVFSGVANILLSNSRPADLMIRTEGDTFIAIRPDIEMDDAQALAERLKEMAIQLRIMAPNGQELPKLSINVAIVEQADQVPMEAVMKKIEYLLSKLR